MGNVLYWFSINMKATAAFEKINMLILEEGGIMGISKRALFWGISIFLIVFPTFHAYANVSPSAEKQKTLKHFIQIAMEPVGETMYVWGGGWNKADTAAGIEALSIGVSPNWKAFYEKQDKHYDTKKAAYMIHNGLDCSGFIGWSLFNLIPNTQGYVMKSGVLTKTLAGYGWGAWYPKSTVKTHIAGDIMGMTGHVWISLGTCDDGSVLILQSSPPGVSLYGTQSGNQKTKAVKLAENYIHKYYPGWYEKFPNCKRWSSYLTSYDMFRWNEKFLPDPDGYRKMSPEEILKDLFSENH